MKLRFEPDGHVYTLSGDSGVIVLPSVSDIIKPLANFDGIPKSVLDFARDRGKAVHLACELYDRDDLNWDSLDPILVPYVEAWRSFCKELDPHWTSIEESEYHKQHLYAGTPDRRGYYGGAKRKRITVDMKATYALSPVVAVQLSGYDLMDEDGPADELISVRLRNDGKFDIKRHKPVHSTFISCLNIFRWKQRNPT